jgi:hypothetical protein
MDHRGFRDCAASLIESATRTPEEYQLGLQLAEALSSAKPGDRNRRLLFAKALYRVGRYDDALPLLEGWQREWERHIISHVGELYLSGWRGAFPDWWRIDQDAMQAMAYLAMTHHCLGHRDRARALLADLRTLRVVIGVMGGRPEPTQRKSIADMYPSLLREAEALIEGRPQSGHEGKISIPLGNRR